MFPSIPFFFEEATAALRNKIMVLLSEQSFRLALAVAPKVSASLSIIGSSFIIRDVLKQRRRRRRSHQVEQCLPATSRVILSMSVADLGSSFFAHFLSTWMVPRGTYDAALAAGNVGTCKAQAYFYELFIYASLLSSALLAMAYWLTICREMSERRLRQWKWQTLLIGTPWILGFANSTPKIILGSETFNGYWWCELAAGSLSDNLLDQIVVGICFITIVLCMVALVRYVYLKEKMMDRFTASSINVEEQQHRKSTIQVTYQGLFYIAVWLIIVLPTIVVTVLGAQSPQGYLVFWALLYPLQGICNALIYFRPKYILERRRERLNGSGTSALGSAMNVLDMHHLQERIISRPSQNNQLPPIDDACNEDKKDTSVSQL